MNFRTLLFCFTTLLVSSVESRRRTLGESCSKTQRCDRQAWLGCINATCNCLIPDEMFYEPGSNKCVSKAGERCKFTLESLDGISAFELSSCTANSVCDADGFCSCIEDFIESPDGTCIPTRKHLESCDEESRTCSSFLSLECKEGTCHCRKGATFSPLQQQCVGLAGQDCVQSKCTANAHCSERTNKCICSSEYFPDFNDKCSLKVGLLQNCTRDEQCHDSIPLKCIDGACSCNPDVALLQKGPKVFEDFPDAACVGKAGSSCVLGRCVDRANCFVDGNTLHDGQQVYRKGGSQARRRYKRSWFGEDEEESVEMSAESTATMHPTHSEEGTCICQLQYSITKVKTCGKSYDSICSKNECMDPLVCKGNKCTCRYQNQVYNPFTLSCQSKVRGPCTVNEDCTKNSLCKLFNNQTFGECVCREGYIDNFDFQCEVRYGRECLGDSDCDSVAGLVCVDGRCDCDGFAKFSPENRICRGLVGGACTGTCNDSLVSNCIENAQCTCFDRQDLKGRKNRGYCTCNEGFSVTAKYSCQNSVGEN